jgi:hypothetical protein
MRGLGFALPVTQISKIVALVAFLMAASCTDGFPVQEPPLDVLVFPVGLTVRQVAPTSAAPAGSSQLVIVNSNFDLRFSEQSGGTVLVVDPDLSQDSSLGGELAVVGAARMGSFGGEVALADAACQPGWPDCPSQCAPLAVDPFVGAGGAKLLVASRSGQTVYRMQMAGDGSLQCGAGCPFVLPVQRLDPYGISIACSETGGAPSAFAFVSHLLSANNLGWISRVNLFVDDDVLGLLLGQDSTYTSIYDKGRELVFVSTSVGLVNATFRWFNPLVTPTNLNGFAVPDFSAPAFSSFIPGATARDMALSSDGRFLYVNVQIYDLTIALQTGAIFTQGGALAIFDLAPTALAQPRMELLGVVRTCTGAGQIRRLPARPGKADLFAITCDLEGALAIFDSDAHTVVRYIGLDPVSGLPVLGRMPFGLAVEPIDPARAIVPVPGAGYEASPCVPGRACDRIYVGSFLDNWVNVLEMDPDQPNQIALVKRIGRGP